MATYQICTNCVMDNASDETIQFDENGMCDYCKTAFDKIGTLYLPNREGEKKLNELLMRLKRGGVSMTALWVYLEAWTRRIWPIWDISGS